MIFCGGNPFLAVKSMIGDYLFVQLTDSYNAGVIVLVVFIGGFIKLMEKSGGSPGIQPKRVPACEHKAEGADLRMGRRDPYLFLRPGNAPAGGAGV